MFLSVCTAAESSKQSDSGRESGARPATMPPLSWANTVPTSRAFDFPAKTNHHWVTVLVAKQSALVFNILQSACAALAVSQDSLTHTQLSGGPLHIAIAVVLMREGYVD